MSSTGWSRTSVFTGEQPRDGDLGECLRHGEFHPMHEECWAGVTLFMMAHPEVQDRGELREMYLLAWENRCLEETVRHLR